MVAATLVVETLLSIVNGNHVVFIFFKVWSLKSHILRNVRSQGVVVNYELLLLRT
jgi:hypothetical protein